MREISSGDDGNFVFAVCARAVELDEKLRLQPFYRVGDWEVCLPLLAKKGQKASNAGDEQTHGRLPSSY